LADLALARRQPAAAIESLRRAHQLEPSSLTLLRLFSIQSAVEGHRAAVQTAEAWLKRRPGDGLVLRALGDSHARQGAHDAAANAYERALKADANDAEALNSLASVRLLQRNAQAITLAQRAVQLEPGNALYIDTLGWAEFRLGNAERALPLLRDARLRLPGNAEIRVHLAEALLKLGRGAEARSELEAAVGNQHDRASASRAAAMLSTLK
jgi:tetratricopeptide (TPR) repeat protein